MQVLVSRLFFISLIYLFCFVKSAIVAKTIVVDQSGRGDFRTIQSAVDSVPTNNNQWIKIHINPGLYKEKVNIVKEKPFILLEGASRESVTIAWDDSSSTQDSATFSVYADNFAARGITFKNTFNHRLPAVNQQKPAVAVLVYGDKASFRSCSFYGYQDTLADFLGRHYFETCLIEGAVDFIFGFGQSIYEVTCLRHGNSLLQRHKRCSISYIGDDPGYITAQGRTSAKDTSGFVFKNSEVYGTGKAYLGRPWASFARVLFYQTNMSNVVQPAGWDPWDKKDHLNTVTFAEDSCTGAGSNTARRVPWEKKLRPEEVAELVSISYIDKDGWLQRQP